jgi:hypothetical protein
VARTIIESNMEARSKSKAEYDIPLTRFAPFKI